jgi:hypothetical protein
MADRSIFQPNNSHPFHLVGISMGESGFRFPSGAGKNLDSTHWSKSMPELATPVPARPSAAALLDKKMKKSHAMISGGVVLAALVIGLGFIGFNISKDFDGVALGSIWPYLLLILALAIALGFEFVNGFHDTANAVATVIYTHSLEPNIAVVWSGMCNLAGVLTSTGTVAFTGITLESQHLVVRPARLEFAHYGRLHHWRGRCQPAHERAFRDFRRGLGAGNQGLQGSAHLANCGLWRCRSVVPSGEGVHQVSDSL